MIQKCNSYKRYVQFDLNSIFASNAETNILNLWFSHVRSESPQWVHVYWLYLSKMCAKIMLKVDKKWNVFDVVLGFLIDNTRFGSSTIGKITQDITNRVKNISDRNFWPQTFEQKFRQTFAWKLVDFALRSSVSWFIYHRELSVSGRNFSYSFSGCIAKG